MQENYATHSIKPVKEVAFPCHGVNAPWMPSSQLTPNYIDIETYLYGIGANNYIFPTENPSVPTLSVPTISFFDRPAVYIPTLEPFLTNQRPL